MNSGSRKTAGQSALHNARNNTDDNSNTGLKRNNEEKELEKKDEVVRSEDIQGYQGYKSIEEIIIGDEKLIGDKSSDSKKNKDIKNKNKIKNGNGKSSGDCLRPKNVKMIITKHNSVEEVSTKVFQPMDNDDESNSIKSSKKSTKKVPKQKQSSEKFSTTEQTLDVLSSKSQDTDSADFVKHNSVEEVSIKVFQTMDNDDESNSIKSSKKSTKKVPKQKQSSEKFSTTEQTLDVLSSKSQDTDSADFVLVTYKNSRKKQKSENTLNTTTSNFTPQDSYLLSQYTQPKTVKNKKKKKFTFSMTHSNKAKDSVQSLPASSALSKQPSYKKALQTGMTKSESVPALAVPKQRASPASIPSPKENNKEVKMLVKQGHSKKDEHSIQSLPASSALSKQRSYKEALQTGMTKSESVPALAFPKQRASPASIPSPKANNKKVKVLDEPGHSKKDEHSVQSLPASSALSKQRSYKEALQTGMTKSESVPALAFPKQRASPASIPSPKANNKKVKVLDEPGHSKKDEHSVQSLPASSAHSKQRSYKEALQTDMTKSEGVPALTVPKQRASPASIPSPKENNKEVKVLGEPGHSIKAEHAMQSLPASSAVYKQPLYKKPSKTAFTKSGRAPAVAVPKQRAFPVFTPSRIVYNKKLKLSRKQGHSIKAEHAMQSLPASSAVYKQPLYKKPSKTAFTKSGRAPAVAVPKQRAFPVFTPSRIVYNKKLKLSRKQGHSIKAEHAMQSLPASSAVYKQPLYKKPSKTAFTKSGRAPAVAVPKQRAFPVFTPSRIVYNKKLKLSRKQGWQDF